MSTTLSFDIIARDRASDKFDRVGDSASKTGDKLKNFAKVGAAAAGVAALAMGKFAIDSIKSASEAQQAVGGVQAVFGKYANSVLKDSKKAATGLGLSAAAYNELITVSGAMLKNKGIEDFAKQSTNLIGIGADLSAMFGGTTKDAVAALNAAMRGESDPIERYGISLGEAAVKAELFANNQGALTGAALEQAKTQARLAIITRQSTDAQGAFARESDTLAGKQARLSAQFENVKSSIGEKLLPVATKFFGFLLDEGVPAVQKLGDWFQQKILPPLRDFAEKAAPKARDVMTAVKGAFEDSKPFLKLVGDILTNVVVPGFKKLLDVAGPMLVDQIKGIGKVLRFVGEAGTWMWNNALQPAFKFMVKGIGWVMEGWSKMLGAMSNIPGFGWAKKASEDMAKAAEKAYAVAEGIKKIPNKKVTVTIAYRYEGRKAGAGSTRGGTDDPSSYLPRANATKSAGERFMEILADGMKAGGKKVDKVLAASRDRVRSAVSQIRDDMKSMSESIASAINQTDFGGGLAELMASLTGNNGALTGLTSVFATLKDSVSKGFLASLMQSGNVGLATSLANDPTAAANASALFDQNAALAGGLGDQSAQAVLGDRIEEIYKRETDRLLKKEDDLPKAIRKELRELFRDGVELSIPGGKGAGQLAYLRTG